MLLITNRNKTNKKENRNTTVQCTSKSTIYHDGQNRDLSVVKSNHTALNHHNSPRHYDIDQVKRHQQQH